MKTQNKKIGLPSAIIIQTNAMIGGGIVAIPAVLAVSTGFLGIISYFFCTLIILCMAFSLGELSLLHGGHAWCYHFPSIWGKHRTGMFASSCYVIGVLIAMGFVAKQTGIWLHEVIPFLSASALALITTGLLSLLIYAGKNVSTFWQYVFSAVIFLGIVFTTVFCFYNFDQEIFFEVDSKDFSAMLLITPSLLYSFVGFESIASLYAIVKNPRKNVLVGGLIGVVCVGLLYIAFSSSIIGAISPKYFTGPEERSLAAVIGIAFPKFKVLPKLLYFGGLFALIGTLHSMVWSVSILGFDVLQRTKQKRVVQLLAESKLSVNHVILFSCLVIMAVSTLLTGGFMMNCAVLLIALSYVLSIMALFSEKKHHLFNRVMCIIGVFGGSLMVLFALYLLIPSI